MGQRPDRVILYGVLSRRWGEALYPQSNVWDGLGVEVVLAEGLPDLLRRGWTGGRQSIVIPLPGRASRQFPRLWWSLAPGPLAYGICANKLRFDRFMSRSGYGDMVPRSWLRARDSQFPCVVKRLNKEGSFGVKVIRSAAELEATLAVPPFRHWPLLFQEMVDGLVDHATHCVAVDGRIAWHVSYAYDIDPATRVQTIDDHAGRRRFDAPSSVLAAFERILAALDYSGPVSFDWRQRGEGIVLFEVNPRFGGSMMLPINRDDLRAALATLLANARPPRWLPT